MLVSVLRSVVRRASAEDVPAIVEIQDVCWIATYSAWIPRHRLLRDPQESQLLWVDRVENAAPGCQVAVVAHDSTVEGFAWSRPWTDTADLPERTVKLNALYVDPEHQGRGLGTALCEHLLAVASGARYTDAALWVVEQNIVARRFYVSQGWLHDPTATKSWRGLVEARYLRRIKSLADNGVRP